METLDGALHSELKAAITGIFSGDEKTGLALLEKALETGLYVRKVSEKRGHVDEENHTIDFVINTDTVDRDGERVKPRSLEKDFDFYKSNPVVLWAHNHFTPAVAKMEDFKFTDQDFSVTDKFAVGTTPLADSLWKLYSAKEPFMRATSVGFIPTEWTHDPADKLPDQSGRTFIACEMIEHSLVNVGSNRLALSKAYVVERDTTLRHTLEAMLDQPTELECGHKSLYGPEGEILDPCPICESEDHLIEGFSEMPDVVIDLFTEKLLDDDVEKPFANEHACRVKQPGLFQPGSFRSMTRKSNGKNYRVILGRLKGKTSLTDQAFRYPKDAWTEGSARGHCRRHEGIKFEKAEPPKSVETSGFIDVKSNDSSTWGSDKDEGAEVLEKFFTMPGTYERNIRDVGNALKDFKPTLGIDRFEFVQIIGTTDFDVVCHAFESDVSYQIDWERDANGAIVFSNPRTVEFIPDGETPVALSVKDSPEDKENPYLPGEEHTMLTEEYKAEVVEIYPENKNITDIDTRIESIQTVVRASAPSDDTTQRLQNIKDAVAEAAFSN